MQDSTSLNEVTSQIPEELPTLPQLERALSQIVQAKYRAWTGHRSSKTVCRIKLDTVTLIIQCSVTPVEKMMDEREATRLRESINRRLKPLLLEVVTEFLGVPCNSIMLDTDSRTGETGAVITLAKEPVVRPSRRSIKTKPVEKH